MKLKFLLIATMTLLASTVFAQEGGLKGRVLSRNGRAAVGNVAVTIEGTTYKARTNDNGFFELKGVPAGDYKLSFTAPEFENLDIVVKVENGVKDINAVIVVPKAVSGEVLDELEQFRESPEIESINGIDIDLKTDEPEPEKKEKEKPQHEQREPSYDIDRFMQKSVDLVYDKNDKNA